MCKTNSEVFSKLWFCMSDTNKKCIWMSINEYLGGTCLIVIKWTNNNNNKLVYEWHKKKNAFE